MKQKGFATIFGLCLILVIALTVKGIQEAENNHAYETMDFQVEFELKNAAVSGIYEAAEKIQVAKINFGNELLPKLEYVFTEDRKNYQYKLINRSVKSPRFGDIKVEVWGERLADNQKFRTCKRLYPSKNLKEIKTGQEGYILFSLAQIKSEHVSGNIYRSAFAYVLSEEHDGIYKDGTTIYFMEPLEN